MRIFKLTILFLCIAGLGYVITFAVPQVSSEADKQTIHIPQNNTQLRDKPSTDGEIIYFADEGEELEIISVHDDWYKVANKNVSAFLSKQLVTVNGKETNPLNNKTIVIDAGHGGQDVGAIGASGVFEKDITYKTAIVLKQKLSLLGANPIFTRSEDKYISLHSRAGFSNTAATDAFISIHYNSSPTSPDASGIGTYYYQEQNKELAQMVQQEVIKQVSGKKDRGIAFGDLQVLRQNYKPAILVELGFISHPEEERLLLTNAYQQQLVYGIISGLEKYFSGNSET